MRVISKTGRDMSETGVMSQTGQDMRQLGIWLDLRGTRVAANGGTGSSLLGKASAPAAAVASGVLLDVGRDATGDRYMFANEDGDCEERESKSMVPPRVVGNRKFDEVEGKAEVGRLAPD
jgi:hypothetical protein